jgi:hypothetical protein
VPFKLNEVQDMFLREATGADIILKSRQQGLSSLILALFTVDFLTVENVKNVVISHEQKATIRLLDRVKYYLNSLKKTFKGDPPFNLKYNSRYEMVNTQKNSVFYIGTAGGRAFGHGDTINNLHFCLSENNMVIGHNGFVDKINSLGTLTKDVRTGTGCLAEVKCLSKKTTKKLGHDHLLSIKSFGNQSLPLEVTPDHKILTREFKTGKPVWKRADELTKKDYIGFPLNNPSHKVKFFRVDYVKGYKSGVKTFQHTLSLNYDLGLLSGWYLAEGSIIKAKYGFKGFILSVDTDEEKEIKNLINKFSDLIQSVGVSINKNSRSKNIRIYSRPLGKYLIELFNEKDGKNIPDVVWNYPREFLLGLIKGLILGDGSIKESRSVSFSSVRPQLVVQLKRLLISLRIGYPSINITPASKKWNRNNRERWTLILFGSANIKLRRILGWKMPDFKTHPVLRKRHSNWNFGRKDWRRGKDYYWSKITSIEQIEAPKFVYDLVLEHPCHSYTTVSGVVHNSEISRYQDAERIYTGVIQAVPKDGRIIIETTANGYGNFFYKLWNKNVRGGSYTNHFFPWFRSKEYTLPVPKGTEFTEEELKIAEKYGLTREQLQWRRWKIEQLNGDVDRFNESFPATPEEAFIVSGNPVWSSSLMKEYLLRVKKPMVVGNLVGYNKNVTVERNEKGYLKIYRKPQEFHRYVIGADVAAGKMISSEGDLPDTDYSCAQVIDANTLEQVAVFHGRIDPDMYGRQLELLGTLYNNALIAVERNSLGLATLITLRDLYYPNIYFKEQFGLIAEKTTSEMGWETTSESKGLMIADTTRLLREKRLVIYDEETIGEMMSFVRTPSGLAEAIPGAHDDRCFIAGTKILTSRGQINIEDIKVGDLVMTRKGYKPVVATGLRYDYVIENKALHLIGTPDHPIITKTGTSRLDNIKATDILYIWNEKLSSIEERSITDILNQKEDSYKSISGGTINGNLPPLRFIDKFGLTTLGRSLRDILFIIKTKILLITLSIILNVFRLKNIMKNILQKRENKGVLRMVKGKLTVLLNNLENGEKIIQKKQEKYIGRMGKIKLREPLRHLPNGERIIEKNSKEYVEKMVKNSISGCGGKRAVYNLKVADCPEYFANNILVHNCIAYMIALQMIGKPQARQRGNEIERQDLGSEIFYINNVPFNKEGQPINPEDSMDVSNNEDFVF